MEEVRTLRSLCLTNRKVGFAVGVSRLPKSADRAQEATGRNRWIRAVAKLSTIGRE
jgi:hypothetical protein